MNLSKEELVKLQHEIEKMGGRKRYIEAELSRRGIVVEQRRSMKSFADKIAKSVYIENRKKEEEARAELRKLTWAAHKTSNISYLGEGIFWSDSLGSTFLILTNVHREEPIMIFPNWKL